jgi:integrase
MGDSGVRRDEAANARRENLSVAVVKSGGTAKPSANKLTRLSAKAAASEVANEVANEAASKAARTSTSVTVWALTIVGTRRKQRTVPVSAAAVVALRAHWADREKDFDAPSVDGPLIAPVVTNGTDASLAKHDGGTDGNSKSPHQPYAADALARLVREAVRRIAGDLQREGALSHDAHAKLLVTSAHAFRHTFGTRAVAREMPIDVVQRILGHASLQTTSIYVHAERQRMLDAAAQYYSEDGG